MRAKRLNRLLNSTGRPRLAKDHVAKAVHGLLQEGHEWMARWRECAEALAAAERLKADFTNPEIFRMLLRARQSAHDEALRMFTRCFHVAFQLEHCDEHEDCRQSPDLAKTCLATRREQTKREI